MLSSNSLFHFTDKVDNLESILDKGIRVSYSLEDFSFLQDDLDIHFSQIRNDWKKPDCSGQTLCNEQQENRFEFAMPMACFCDIPLFLIEEHSRVYGRYAVGLKKEWGLKRGMNPVTYVAKESDMAAVLQDLESLSGQADEHGPEYMYRNIFSKFIQLTKPYKGYYSRGDREWNQYRFYDEREWRYIEKGDYTQLLTKNQLDNLGADKHIVGHLSLHTDDIDHIIVSHAEEKQQFEQWAQPNRDGISIRAIDEVTGGEQNRD
jgi:hypothetical protein